jgi:ribosome-associated protein
MRRHVLRNLSGGPAFRRRGFLRVFRRPPVNIPGHQELLRAGELAFDFYRSSGPGGQNVNKVSTAVRLRFDVRGSRTLPGAVRARLAGIAGGRMTTAGVLVIEAQRHRTQEGNRRDALERLDELIERAWRPPVPRRPMRPSRGAKERRLDEKKGRGAIKRGRARPSDAD